MLLMLPLLTWFLFKPIRVLAPELNGMTCPEQYLCVDDPRNVNRAKSLYEDALLFVHENVGVLNTKPMVIFCTAEICSKAFGMGRRSAMQLPMGIVIGPRAWKEYYVSHELIHQLQQQKFGVLYVFQKPKWYLEGMAYLLSDDPRLDLNEPLQKYRQEFKVWLSSVGKDNLWLAGEKL
ncbi:MAG: hypothetical protein KUG80_04120 [Gammaproteobacteria bacterium]|nr:hypothetical protein [Gammaproteobacteria bacterium]